MLYLCVLLTYGIIDKRQICDQEDNLMNKAIIYIHGKGGSAEEAGHYKMLFEEYDVIGFDYKA